MEFLAKYIPPIKKYRISICLFIFLIAIPVLYFSIHRFWIGAVEDALRDFNLSKKNTEASLSSILSNLKMKKYDYVCILDFYQTSLKEGGIGSENKHRISRKVNLLLNDMNYRKDFLSFSRSEGSQALIFFNENGSNIHIEEVSKNIISLMIPAEFPQCSKYEDIYLSKITDTSSFGIFNLSISIK